MPPLARCRTCNALVRWVDTVKGNRAIIDVDPVPNGNVLLRRNDAGDFVAHFVSKTLQPEPGESRYVVHHVTCPNRRQHTRPQHVRELTARRRAGH